MWRQGCDILHDVCNILQDPETSGRQERGVLEGIVNKDENTAKSYFKKACDAGESTACNRS